MNASKKRNAYRTAQLAAIHIAAKRLRLDRDTYVALLQRIAKVASAKDLDARGRHDVLAELGRLAGDGKVRARNAVPPPGAPAQVREELQAMTDKLGAIAAELNLPWTYLDGMAKRMFGVEKTVWLTAEQMHKLVAALSIHQKRQRKARAQA